MCLLLYQVLCKDLHVFVILSDDVTSSSWHCIFCQTFLWKPSKKSSFYFLQTTQNAKIIFLERLFVYFINYRHLNFNPEASKIAFAGSIGRRDGTRRRTAPENDWGQREESYSHDFLEIVLSFLQKGRGNSCITKV